MNLYDAIVVGAGPAGACAAHTLAEGGARVLLLEKARLPRYKPCGGGITERARQASPLVAGYPAETCADSVIVTFDHHRLDCALPAPIGMVMRDRFDAYLTGRAVDAGTELRDNCPVTAIDLEGPAIAVHARGETVRASYLIGADGANGITARLAGFGVRRPPGAAIEVELEVPESDRARYEHALLLDLHAIAGGYGWIFGKADRLSVGLGVFHRGRPPELRAALETFIERHADLKHGKELLRRGHLIPLAGGRRAWQSGHVLLAGDAASLADPLTAEGISYALASGHQAGRSVLAALGGNATMLAGYNRYIKHDLCGDLRYARIIAALSYRYPDVVVRLGRDDATLLKADTGAVSGTLEYRDLLWHMARRAPALLRQLLIRRTAAAPA